MRYLSWLVRDPRPRDGLCARRRDRGVRTSFTARALGARAGLFGCGEHRRCDQRFAVSCPFLRVLRAEVLGCVLRSLARPRPGCVRVGNNSRFLRGAPRAEDRALIERAQIPPSRGNTDRGAGERRVKRGFRVRTLDPCRFDCKSSLRCARPGDRAKNSPSFSGRHNVERLRVCRVSCAPALRPGVGVP